MEKRDALKKYLCGAAALFLLFIVFTVLVKTVDVRYIGPDVVPGKNTPVGFGGLNGAVRGLVGESENHFWYAVTQFLGYFALLICAAFAALGAYQLVRRKSLLKVSPVILTLGAFYLVVLTFYAFFEFVIVNARPVLMDGELEASYPSSHTVLAVCVFVSAMIALGRLFPDKKNGVFYAKCLLAVLTVVTVAGRVFSGVHWITDIIGGLILSAALLFLFCAGLRVADILSSGKDNKSIIREDK